MNKKIIALLLFAFPVVASDESMLNKFLKKCGTGTANVVTATVEVAKSVCGLIGDHREGELAIKEAEELKEKLAQALGENRDTALRSEKYAKVAAGTGMVAVGICAGNAILSNNARIREEAAAATADAKVLAAKSLYGCLMLNIQAPRDKHGLPCACATDAESFRRALGQLDLDKTTAEFLRAYPPKE